MLISDRYRDLNRELHQKGSYGTGGARWADHVKGRIRDFDFKSVLDYGCGQGTLRQEVGSIVAEYDPAIEEKSRLPDPADFVVCTDVLEHVEPELLENVIDHIHSVCRQWLFCTISTRPAKKLLSDGSNAHLIVEPAEWWLAKLARRFEVLKSDIREDLVLISARPLDVGAGRETFQNEPD